MAKGKRFIETPIDQTPYGACAVVAVIALLILALGTWAAWVSGGYLKRTFWPHWSTSRATTERNPQATNDPFEAAQNQLDALKNEAKAAIQQEAEAQAQQAAEAAKDAAAEALKNEAQNQLDNFRQNLP